MNRNQLRAERQHRNKYEAWLKSLPHDKQIFIAEHVKEKVDKIHADTTDILDSCYIGAMIEEMEIDLDDCIRIASKANVNMKITLDILNLEKEVYYMKVNDEKERAVIREKAKEKLTKNPKESTLNISRELQENFDLPIKDLHIIVAEARKEIKASKKTITNNENVKELDLIPKEATGELKATLANEGEHGFEIVPVSIREKDLEALKELTTEKPKELAFKIKLIMLEGKNGNTYTKDDRGVKLEDKLYKDIEEMEKEKEIVTKNLKDQEMKLKEEMDNINKKLWDVEARREERNGMYAEIKQIFQM